MRALHDDRLRERCTDNSTGATTAPQAGYETAAAISAMLVRSLPGRPLALPLRDRVRAMRVQAMGTATLVAAAGLPAAPPGLKGRSQAGRTAAGRPAPLQGLLVPVRRAAHCPSHHCSYGLAAERDSMGLLPLTWGRLGGGMRLMDATESRAGKCQVLMHASQGVQVGDQN